MAEPNLNNLNSTNLIPRRNAGLIRRVWGAIVETSPVNGPQLAEQQTTQSGVVNSVADKVWDNYFQTQNDRISVASEVEEMDSSSEEASAALDIIADNATSSEDGRMASFEVKATGTTDIQQILNDTTARSRLHTKAYTLTRSLLKYGDLFAEICVNGQDEIVDVRMLHSTTMHRNEDPQGNMMVAAPRYNEDGKCLNKKGECAFEQHDSNRGHVIAAFYPFQICHARWNWDGFSKYGRSYMHVTRVIWKKVKAEEEALIIGRLTRAMLKMAFYVDTTGSTKPQKEQALREFRDNITRTGGQQGKRESPFSVLTDFFFTAEHYKVGGQVVESRTRADVIDPKNEGLSQIGDVEHFHRKMLATLRVPPAYLTFEKDVNAKSTVTMQDIQFVRVLRRTQQCMGQFLKQIYDTALVLAGHDPETTEIEYDIIWPPLSTNDSQARADADFKEAQAAAILLGTSSFNQTPVVTPEWVMKNVLEMDDDDADELMAALQVQQQIADERAQKAAELAQQNAVELAESKQPPSATGDTTNASDGKPTDSPTGHDATEKLANGSNTNKRAMRQEATEIGDAVRTRLRASTDPLFARILTEQQNLVLETRQIAALPKNGNGHHK